MGTWATPFSRRRGRGYTAVEVMMSIALLGVGAAGVMSMQKTSIRANLQARRLDLANSLARTWIERLRTDATAWTLPNASQTSSNITNAKLLMNGTTPFVDSGRASADDGWYLPDQRLTAPTGGTMLSPAFDILGRDVAVNSGDRFFCTHVRLDCLVPTTTTSGTPNSCSLLRVSARVFWPKDGAQVLTDYCSSSNIATVQNAAGSPYSFIYAVSALRQNLAP